MYVPVDCWSPKMKEIWTNKSISAQLINNIYHIKQSDHINFEPCSFTELLHRIWCFFLQAEASDSSNGWGKTTPVYLMPQHHRHNPNRSRVQPKAWFHSRVLIEQLCCQMAKRVTSGLVCHFQTGRGFKTGPEIKVTPNMSFQNKSLNFNEFHCDSLV